MNSTVKSSKQLDSYSMFITSKYLISLQDYINLICVNSKFKETTEKLRFNPIPIKSLKLFPKIQTQYLYSKNDKKIGGIDNYEIWYKVTYDQYLLLKEENIKYHYIYYTHDNRMKYGDKIPESVTVLDDYCFGSTDFFENVDANKIKKLTITPPIKSLNDNCFYYCSSLISVNLPSSLTKLGNYCFDHRITLKSINLFSILQCLGNGWFINCSSLQSITLPFLLTVLGN
ncbi:Leucine rich repeat protein [Entamoeba marina]